MVPRHLNKPLFYIHIPKTAGTTLQQLVFHNYSDNEIYLIGRKSKSDNGSLRSFKDIHADSKKRLKDPAFDKNHISVVFGHMNFGLHEYFDQGGQYATMLRHPVSRIISHFDFVRRNTSHHLHSLVVGNGMTIDDYIERTEALVLNNGQTRAVYGEDHVNIEFGKCSQDLLNGALRNIRDHFVFVGVQELFNESVQRFLSIMDWEAVDMTPKNVSDVGRYDVNGSTVNKILKYNSLDLRLYEQMYANLRNV